MVTQKKNVKKYFIYTNYKTVCFQNKMFQFFPPLLTTVFYLSLVHYFHFSSIFNEMRK